MTKFNAKKYYEKFLFVFNNKKILFNTIEDLRKEIDYYKKNYLLDEEVRECIYEREEKIKYLITLF